MVPSHVGCSLASRSFRRLFQIPRAAFHGRKSMPVVGTLTPDKRSMPWLGAISWKSMMSKMGPFFAGLGLLAKGVARSETVPSLGLAKEGTIASAAKRAHIYFLLDRSGSMHCIADDVIGGFNAFVKEQQRSSNDCSGLDMTMVQFDSKNPQEVLFSDRDIDDVPLLCTSTFQPRAATPLFDAMGGILTMAEETQKSKNADSQIVIVTFTDGMENASKEHSKKCILSRIDAKQKEGWTFVFLGANQDSYAEGGQLGYAKANIQNFAFDSQGTQKAWESMGAATQTMRAKLQKRTCGVYSNEDFFDGVKTAEDDFESRKSQKDVASQS